MIASRECGKVIVFWNVSMPWLVRQSDVWRLAATAGRRGQTPLDRRGRDGRKAGLSAADTRFVVITRGEDGEGEAGTSVETAMPTASLCRHTSTDEDGERQALLACLHRRLRGQAKDTTSQ